MKPVPLQSALREERPDASARPSGASGPAGPCIRAAAGVLPPNRYAQSEIVEALRLIWRDDPGKLRQLERLHRRVGVGSRSLALPLEAYPALGPFDEWNDASIRVATDLGSQAAARALELGGLGVEEVGHLFWISTTGIATPSVDARIANRLGRAGPLARTPIFGLGCAGGVAGIGRAADWLRAHPEAAALVVSVELCSLTLQREDRSAANLIASGLFGDGGVAVLLVGAGHRTATTGPGPEGRGAGPGGAASPRVLASRAILYPDSEHLMGWEVGASGLRLVLSPDIPDVVRARLGADVDAFLGAHGHARADIARWICHPGGPKVLEAIESALELPPDALAPTWRSLEALGNVSSSSVLFVLEEVLRAPPPPGAFGLMLALGPGFSAELVLLAWE